MHAMETGPSSALQLPSFLHGTYAEVTRKTRKEGRRCGDQYRKDGSFPTPREILEVPASELVIAHEVVDFQRTTPYWRLHMVSGVLQGVYEAVDFQNVLQIRDAYEAFAREMAWGALLFAIEPTGPESAGRTALRLQAVLHFWETLQSVRYVFKRLDTVLTLEGLMLVSNDWAMDAWCPTGETSVKGRLEAAALRMARATKEDSIEAILRQVPRALASARGLKRRDILTDPAFLRQRLATLEPAYFDRVSGARTANVLELLYDLDHQLGVQ